MKLFNRVYHLQEVGQHGMKLLKSDGRTLTVRDVGPVSGTWQALRVPFPFHGSRIMPDDEARDFLKDILSTRLYTKVDTETD